MTWFVLVAVVQLALIVGLALVRVLDAKKRQEGLSHIGRIHGY